MAQMWQIRWQIYPPRNGNFTFLLTDSHFQRSDVAEQVADLPPKWLDNGGFRFLLTDSYSQDLTCGRSTPLENGDFIFLLIDSYSESSHVGTSGGRCSPHMKWQL